MTAQPRFRDRLLRREPLAGIFIKTPSPHVIEVLGTTGFDFVVIDEEHAPFDRAAVDLALLAARAAGLPALVRPAVSAADKIQAALDGGACGVLAPHVDSGAAARRLVSMCRYGGGRGFSNSPRAGGYGSHSLWEHVDQSDETTAVIGMIEDCGALDRVDSIVATEGLDGVFIGCADLTVSLRDRSEGALEAAKATQRIVAAAAAAGKPACLFVSSAEETAEWRARGVTTFIIGSDQSLLKSAAVRTARAFIDR